jgi:hypothetical protein
MSKISPDRTPINRQTAMIMAGGEKPMLPNKNEHFRSHGRPEVFNQIPKFIKQAGWRDLTNIKFGRFTIIGLKKDNVSRWVARCSCGVFELKKAKAIKSKLNDLDMCNVCRKFEYLKKGRNSR